jgi:hypothetical protein
MLVPAYSRVLSATAAGLVLASVELGPTSAQSPKPLDTRALHAMTRSCEDALAARLPLRHAVRLAEAPHIEQVQDGVFHLVSSFEAGSSRTPFACEAFERDGQWEVAGLTLVQW